MAEPAPAVWAKHRFSAVQAVTKSNGENEKHVFLAFSKIDMQPSPPRQGPPQWMGPWRDCAACRLLPTGATLRASDKPEAEGHCGGGGGDDGGGGGGGEGVAPHAPSRHCGHARP